MCKTVSITWLLMMIVGLGCSLVDASAMTRPAELPHTIVLPDEIAPVFVIYDHYEVNARGGETLSEHEFELRQEVSDAAVVVDHFTRLAQQLGWTGEFRDTEDGIVGHFRGDDMQLAIRLQAPSDSNPWAMRWSLRVVV